MEEVKHDKCTTCKSWKPIPMFLNATGRKLKTCLKCRERDKAFRSTEVQRKKRIEYNKNYNEIHSEKIKKQQKEYRSDPIIRERKRLQTKKWNYKNKCEHNRYKSSCKECGGASICEHSRYKSHCKECGGGHICEHNRKKSQCKECGGSQICEHDIQKSNCKICDPQGHLAKIVRNSVRRALKANKSKKSIEYLGCSVEEFKEHIEKQFEEGMTWENHGEWHIDHIIPLKFENPSLEETIERLNWKNTQPLWASDNMSKGNRFCG
jgi:hypothetical protein